LVVARELIAAREPLTPVLAGEPLYEKPVLAYAPDVVATLVARSPLHASRAWRAIVAGLLVLVTGSIGARHLGARAGMAAAAVLATSLALPLAARVDGTQLIASLLAWVAIAGFSDALFGRRSGRDAWLLVSYMALASVAVCCGPLAALWPLAAVQLYLRLARRSDGWTPLRPIPGFLLVAALALPWYAAMLERHGLVFLVHAMSFPYGLSAHGSWFVAPFLAVSLLVAGSFPWCALLPGALTHAAAWWRKPRAPAPGVAPGLAPIVRELSEELAAHWFIACAVAALLPILAYSTPPVTAVLPALPAAALLCGRLIDHVFEDPSRLGDTVMRSAQMLSMMGSVAALLLVLLASRLRDVAPPLNALAATLFVTGWLPFLAVMLRRWRLGAVLMAGPVIAGTLVVMLRVLPAAESYVSSRPAAEALTRVMPVHAPVVVLEEPSPSFRLHLRHNIVRLAGLNGDFARARASDGYIYLAFRPAREADITRILGARLQVLARGAGLVAARLRP
jgi:4-amino-4-deoxy-L-arabinose transferase-like glycosyltransferase